MLRSSTISPGKQWVAGFIFLLSLTGAPAAAQSTPASSEPAQEAARQSTPAGSLRPAGPPDRGPDSPAFRVTTRMVVVDVVARDKKDQTVNDLEASDFSLREGGREQKISTFNFQHPGRALAPAAAGATLPPNVFRNIPKFQALSALNVILIDGLNSTLLNQAYVRAEMVKFLDKLPQGQPIAIYALGRRLLLLQDFTTDLTELKKVIQTFKGHSSHVLSNPTGTSEAPMTLQGWAAQVVEIWAPQLKAQIDDFAQDTSSNQMDIRVQHTVEALNLLARTLSGYPGRKNLIWITESIPMNVFADNGEVVIQSSVDSMGPPARALPKDGSAARARRDYASELALVANLLADAQVAVYPVDARGLVGSPFLNVANPMSGQSAMGGAAVHAEGRFSEELFQAHSNMEDMAEKTGGKAFFNRNDIDNAVRGDMDDGSTYYSLGYYPENKNWDGKFRRIQIASKRSGVKLRYRLGYFAMDRAAYMKDHPRQRDMELDLALNPNSPVSTALQFEAEVLPPSQETQNKVRLNYAVDPHAISFERGVAGLEHAELDCAVRVFSPGKIDTPVKSEGARMSALLKPNVYKMITQSFFPCQLNIDLPPGNYFLRLAVRDNATGLLGTVNAQLAVPPLSAQAGTKPADNSH
jgi:VWFA-related protein